jgi:hypothetical protein
VGSAGLLGYAMAGACLLIGFIIIFLGWRRRCSCHWAS